jgi:hypothetical protein
MPAGTTIPPTVQAAIARELTRLSNVRWRAEPGNPEHGRHEFTLVSADHHSIMVSTMWQNVLRLEFRALEPERPAAVTYKETGGVTFPKITVAKDRVAEHIAKDVNRRLLPLANQAWEDWHDRVGQIIDRRTAAGGKLEHLAQLVRNPTVKSVGKDHSMSWWQANGIDGGIYAVADVHEYSGTIDVSLTGLPVELAAALIRRVAAYTPPGSATP